MKKKFEHVVTFTNILQLLKFTKTYEIIIGSKC